MLRSISHLLVIAAIVLIGFLGFGCSHEENPPLGPAKVATPPPDPESVTIENAQLVCGAVNAWIAGNDSLRFPEDLTERNENGKTIVDLLPDGQLLLNQYSGERSVPQNCSWPPEPGFIYYCMLGSEPSYYWGYGVYAYGSDGLLWKKEVHPIDFDEAERRTLVNLVIVWIAVEDWARENNGTYPGMFSELNLAGHTTFDLLPEGQRLENPFLRENSEPSVYYAASPGTVAPRNGAAPGEITYTSLQSAWAKIVGYWIQASNSDLEYFHMIAQGDEHDTHFDLDHFAAEQHDFELYTLSYALSVREAVRAWSIENNGGYPATLSTANLLGHTVIDLMPHGIHLPNVYTRAASEPRDGAATASGQIGYRGIDGVGGYSNYRIEAYGKEGMLWSYESDH